MTTIKKSSTKSKTKVNIKKEIRKEYCIIHHNRRAFRYCENCERPYCNDCIKEYWSHNFLSYAYLGEKKDFQKQYYCIECEKSKRRKNLAVASSILIILLISILASIFLK